MNNINHIALAKEFGARISTVARPGFGYFSALRTYGLAEKPKLDERDHVDPSEDPAIAKAFEEIRNGYSPDVVFSWPELKNRFIARCRKLGVKASAEAVARRVVDYRKSKKLGINLSKTTRESDADPNPYLYAAELAYVQTSYRFDVSIDDLLFVDEARDYFVSLAEKIRPGGRPLDYLTAALYIRKTRNFAKDDRAILRRIESAQLEPRFRTVADFQTLQIGSVPDKEGIFLMTEKPTAAKDRTLYIGSGMNLRDAVTPFIDLNPFKAIANSFWKPNPVNIFLRVASLHDFEGVPTRSWEMKLIHDRSPIFNVPVKLKTAA